jgi:hypothetical protein
MKLGILASSGVGQFERDPLDTDGIGDVAAILAQLPGVSVKVTRMVRTRFRRAQAIAECVSWLLYENDFDVLGMVAHSAGCEFDCDIAHEVGCAGRKIDWAMFSDGWAKDGCLFIPSSVVRGESWTQEHPKSKIHGVPIVLESEATEWVRHPPLATVKHAAMSSLPAFHQSVLERAKG